MGANRGADQPRKVVAFGSKWSEPARAILIEIAVRAIASEITRAAAITWRQKVLPREACRAPGRVGAP